MSLTYIKKLVMAKIETSYATDAAPVVATDCVLLSGDPQHTPLNLDYVDRDLVRAFLGQSDQLPTNAYSMIEFDVEVAGMKALGVATPTLTALLRACAYAVTVTAGTSVVCAPVSSGFESCTIYHNIDGQLQKMVGCRGTVDMEFPNNGLAKFHFKMMGLYAPPTDTAQGTAVYTDYKTPVVVNNVNTSAFSLFGFSGVMKSLKISSGNDPVFRSLVGGTDQAIINERKAKGSLSIELPTITAKDFWSIAKAGTTGALSITHGPAANRCKVDLPKFGPTNLKVSNDQGVAMLEMDTFILPNAGNDEISISFL